MTADGARDISQAIEASQASAEANAERQRLVAMSMLSEIADNGAILESILDVLKSPRETAAREYLRRGIRAYKHNWMDDAEDELRRAIDHDRYIAPSHLYLGLVLEDKGDRSGAQEEYARAIKYGVEAGRLAATAAIKLMSVTLALNDAPPTTQRALEQARASLTRCPEFLLADAAFSGDRDQLLAATSLAPELAIEAQILAVPHSADALPAILADSDSSVTVALRVLTLLTELAGDGSRFGSLAEFGGVPSSDPERFVRAGAVLRESVALEREARAVLEQRRHEERQERERERQQQAAVAAYQAALTAHLDAKAGLEAEELRLQGKLEEALQVERQMAAKADAISRLQQWLGRLYGDGMNRVYEFPSPGERPEAKTFGGGETDRSPAWLPAVWYSSDLRALVKRAKGRPRYTVDAIVSRIRSELGPNWTYDAHVQAEPVNLLGYQGVKLAGIAKSLQERSRAQEARTYAAVYERRLAEAHLAEVGKRIAQLREPTAPIARGTAPALATGGRGPTGLPAPSAKSASGESSESRLIEAIDLLAQLRLISTTRVSPLPI